MRAMMLVLAALLAAGCDRGDNTAQEAPPSGEAVGARPGPDRPPEAQTEGMWQLTQVSGGGLPAAVQHDGDCHVEVIDATLRLEANRFAFQNHTREVCGNTQGLPEPVLHSAGGTYTREGDVLVFTTDVGTAFASARGRADSTTLLLSELATQAGAETISWTFARRDEQLVPVGGTTGEPRTSD